MMISFILAQDAKCSVEAFDLAAESRYFLTHLCSQLIDWLEVKSIFFTETGAAHHAISEGLKTLCVIRLSRLIPQ